MPHSEKLFRFAAAVLVATAATQAIAADRVERTTIQILGNRAGYQEAVYRDDGSVTVHYEFNDRGRGPKLDATYQVADDGTVSRSKIEGVAYFKTPVAETFERTSTSTRWKNGSEDQTSDQALPGFYLGLDATPEESVLMARALLAAPNHEMPMLPVGSVRLREVTRLGITREKERLEAVLYALDGLDLSPSYLWLDADQRFLAVASGWQSQVREGWEASLPELTRKQEETEQAYTISRAASLTHTLKGDLVVDPVRVFDPSTGHIAEGQRLLIRDGRIEAVGPVADIVAPEGADRIDGGNRFVMPGMWDMHVHMGGNADGLLHLASGVTTVRDLANDRDTLTARIEAIESGKDVGPRVIRAGFVDGRSPYSGPTKVFADTEAEVRAAMAQFKKDGVFEQVKVYSSLKPELVPLFAELAHAQGMRLSGHVPDGMSPEEFVRAGADELQHANFLLLNFLDRSKLDTRTPQRFTAVAEQGSDIPLHGEAMQRFIDLLRERGTVLDPTLVTFEGMFLDRPGRMGPTMADTVHRLPATWQRYVRAANGGLAVTPETDLKHRDAYRRMMDLVGLMHRSGVTIVAGTDTSPLFALARELELYTQAGIPPADALKIATIQSARVMKRDHEYGLVKPGYVADLILIDGDPTKLITDLRRVHTVIRGDRWFEAAALYRSVGIVP